jgi:hypothetical protein
MINFVSINLNIPAEPGQQQIKIAAIIDQCCFTIKPRRRQKSTFLSAKGK